MARLSQKGVFKVRKKSGKGLGERRVQYMLPCALHAEMKKLPLVFLPLAPLEWHGPHLAMGVDPVNAERTALAAAEKIGGVVMPTLYMGTERERPPEMLKSLGFREDEYIVGMDFPKAKGLFKSFYFSEELFSLTVRGHIELLAEHGYKYIFIVNGHGAVNHNDVLRRLCAEFNGRDMGFKTAFSMSFPDKALAAGAASHAGFDETSLMMFFDKSYADISKLPPKNVKLKYCDYSVVDSGGFTGKPGKGHTVCAELDPRWSTPEDGAALFADIVADVTRKVKKAFGLS
jgi:creatinine amidohydrolase